MLSAVITVPKSAERLIDTYYDTADWRIGRSGHVLRVRHRARRAEMTLKGLAKSSAGLRRRLEVTEPLPADGITALGAHGPVGWRLRALAGKRALQPILEVRTRRRPFDLRVSGETVAEAALDETTIVVGDVPARSAPARRGRGSCRMGRSPHSSRRHAATRMRAAAGRAVEVRGRAARRRVARAPASRPRHCLVRRQPVGG